MPEKSQSRWNISKVIPSVRLPGRTAVASHSSVTSPSSLLKSKSLSERPPALPKDLPLLPPLLFTQSIERKPIGGGPPSPSSRSPSVPTLPPNPLPTPFKDTPRTATERELPSVVGDRLQPPLLSPHLRQATPSVVSISSLLSAYTRDFDDAHANASSLETTPTSWHGSDEESRERTMTRESSNSISISSSSSRSPTARIRRSDKLPWTRDQSDATALATATAIATADVTNGSGSRSSRPGPGVGAGINVNTPTSTCTSVADAPPQHTISTGSRTTGQSSQRLHRANPLPPTIVKDDARQTRAPPSTTIPPEAPVEQGRRFAPTVEPKLNLPQPPIKVHESQAALRASDPFGPIIHPIPAAHDKTPLPPPPPPPPPPSSSPPPPNSYPPPATQNMGNEASKLRHFKDKFGSSQRLRSESAASMRTALSKTPVPFRPPTPEYRKEEEPRAIDLFISPVSPVSPGVPRNVSLESLAKELPSSKAASDETKIGVPAAQSDGKELPSIPVEDPNIPIRTTSAPKPPSPLQEPAARHNSQLPSARPPSTRPPPTRPESRNMADRERNGAAHPEIKVDREAPPDAAHFPEQQFNNPASQGIYKAVPLSNAHLTCYQRHRTMHRRGNRRYPLTCQTCDKADVEDRWACAFCNLQVCESCLRRLGGYRRDLGRLVDELASKTHLGPLPSPKLKLGEDPVEAY